jgi:hypothetical protein
MRGQVNISQQQRLAVVLQQQLSSGARISPQQQQQLLQAQVRVMEAQQQAQVQAQGHQGQTPVPQQVQPGQAPTQQSAIQIQTHNLPTQPAAQPFVTTMQFLNGKSASPSPQTVTSTSGTPVSINGGSNGSANGNGGAVIQRPASVQNPEATSTQSPLDPETAAVIASIGSRPTAYYNNTIQTLQSMFETNESVTVNPNGSTQTRFQATPQVRSTCG